MQILKTWNIRLMESITFNPQQLNEISSVLNTSTMPGDGKKGRGGNVSKSFRSLKHNSVKAPNQQDLRRADSFSKVQSYRTDIGGSGLPPGGLSQGGVRIGGLPPLPREANTRSWGGDDHLGPGGILGALSQDSVFTHSTGLLVPPPLPPRPNFKSYSHQDDNDDPDYAYIKEDEVEGPPSAPDTADGGGVGVKKHRPSISVDDVLSMLEQDIMRENRAKKEEEQRKRTMTLDRVAMSSRSHMPPMTLGPRVHVPVHKPQDYTDFVPAIQRPHLKSTSSEPDKPTVAISHAYSASEPDSRVVQPSPARIGMQPPAVFENQDEEMDSLLPRKELVPDHTPNDYSDFIPSAGQAPALPPRSWRNTSSSSYASLSSSGNLGNDSGSAVFTPASEVGVVWNGKGLLEGSSDASGGEKPVSSAEPSPSQDKKLASQTTPPPDKENKAPPATIPEETLPPTPPAGTPEAAAAPAPPLPPRSPTKEKLYRKSSSSSTSSGSSTGRCPRCRSLRKHKTSVSKTVSLDQRPAAAANNNRCHHNHEECRKSMPDLGDAKPLPENSLGGRGHHHHHSHARVRENSHCSRCSPVSSTDALHGESTPPPTRNSSSFDYLQLLGEEQKDVSPTSSSIENELGAEMDLLNSCLQTLEYLENKVKETTSAGATSTMTSVVSHSAHNHTPSTTTQLWMGTTTTGSKVKPMDAKRSVYAQAKIQADLAMAELNQPLYPTAGKAATSHTHLIANGHHQQLTKQNTMPLFTIPSTISGPRSHPNGTLRSTSSTSLTTPSSGPPIPPRSMVSLTDPKAMSLNRASPPKQSSSPGLLHLQSTLPTRRSGYNRSVSSGNMVGVPHQPPVRSATTFSTHAPPTRGHPSLTRHHHLEPPGQSSTVFIHHIKDRRGGLTHLV